MLAASISTNLHFERMYVAQAIVNRLRASAREFHARASSLDPYSDLDQRFAVLQRRAAHPRRRYEGRRRFNRSLGFAVDARGAVIGPAKTIIGKAAESPAYAAAHQDALQAALETYAPHYAGTFEDLLAAVQ